jgi:hypothetical protein
MRADQQFPIFAQRELNIVIGKATIHTDFNQNVL